MSSSIGLILQLPIHLKGWAISDNARLILHAFDLFVFLFFDAFVYLLNLTSHPLGVSHSME